MNELTIGIEIMSGRLKPENVTMPSQIRDKHIYILGKSGSGKSSLINNLVFEDILAGEGLAVIDPHGDLVENILTLIPKNRLRDVVYLNLGDEEYSLAFNPLERIKGVSIATQTDYLVNAFKHIWIDSWGPRTEYILTNTITALIEAKETLLLINPFLSEEKVRKKILNNVKNPLVRKYFANFDKYDERYKNENISPIINKMGQLIMHPQVQHIFSVKKSKIDLRFTMDNKKIFLVNLAKGDLGEGVVNLFGSVLLSLLGAAAYSRNNIPKKERVPFYLYVDEFQNFTTDKFASLLSEIRKYGLSLCLANQYLYQIKREIREAVLGNVYNLLVMRSNPEDVKVFETYLRPYPVERIYELDSYEIVYLVAGSYPVFAKIYTPYENIYEQKEKIIKVSRERFSVKKNIIENKLARFYKEETDYIKPKRYLIKRRK